MQCRCSKATGQLGSAKLAARAARKQYCPIECTVGNRSSAEPRVDLVELLLVKPGDIFGSDLGQIGTAERVLIFDLSKVELH
jgi:hypothetical protein